MLLLNEKNITFDVIEYLKNPLTKEEVLILAGKLGMHPGEFVRKKEKEFVVQNMFRTLKKCLQNIKKIGM